MKQIFISFAFLILISCNNSSKDKAKDSNDGPKGEIKDQNGSTSSITTSTSSSHNGFNTTYSLTEKNEDDEAFYLNANSFISIENPAKITLGLHFKNSNAKISDSLDTQHFQKYFDLKNVKKIQIDSFKYVVENSKIDLRFKVLISRKDDKKSQEVDMYSIKYLSNFKDPKPLISLVKVDKHTVENFDN